MEMFWSSSRKFKTILALGRKYMAHNHGNEYQIRIVHEDGSEELSGLLNSIEQVAQAMIAVDRPQGKLTGFWYETFSVTTAQIRSR